MASITIAQGAWISPFSYHCQRGSGLEITLNLAGVKLILKKIYFS